jgi:hypothetical protein
MRFITILIFCIQFSVGYSQDKQQRNSPFTIRGNIGINKPLTSKQFSRAFLGIYEANVSFNYQVAGNFYAGIGFENIMFKNSERFKLLFYQASLPYNTRLNGNGGFLKLGYDKFVTESIYVSYALNTGYILAKYINVHPDTSLLNRPYPALDLSAPFVQPEFSANFVTEKSLSFSLIFAYNTLFYRFNPKAPRFNDIDGVTGVSNKYLMSWVTFGFGFTVLLGNKK